MSVRATLDAHGLRPQKKFGQHFLTDPRILESVADAAQIQVSDTILEIGPGLGHLTRVLAKRAGRVVAVELDRGLAAKLEKDFEGARNVEIIQGDFLEKEPVDWLRDNSSGAGQLIPAPASISFKVVANLPYYITSAVLRHVLDAAIKPLLVVVTVQKEVAQRMMAGPPDMNLLAVSVQLFSKVQVVRKIAAGAFTPRPKVDSAVVRLDVYDRAEIGDITRFFEIVRAGFGERRKQLRNALAHNLSLHPDIVTAALARAGIHPERRAQTLTLAEWDSLSRQLTARTV